LTWVDVHFAHGALEVSGPLPDRFVGLSTIALIAALAAVYWWIWRRMSTEPLAAPAVARESLVVLLAALATSKVFSPQYLVWLTPLLALVEQHRQALVVTLFAILGILTVFVYPFHYQGLLAREAIPIVALTLRNGLIVTVAILLMRDVRVARTFSPA
jgi:hypothetical protein